MENKNSNCKQCGAPTVSQMELVTVKTMVDRGWRKNKYYQAMGDVINIAICDNCLDKYINQIMNPTKKILRLSLLTSVVVSGCVILFFWISLTAFRVFCAIIAGIAILSFLQELSIIKKRTEAAKKRNEKDNRKTLAVDMLAKFLPKKHVDAELTYIDIRRIKKDNLELLGKEYGVSYKKLVAIRNFLKDEKRNQKLEEIEN